MIGAWKLVIIELSRYTATSPFQTSLPEMFGYKGIEDQFLFFKVFKIGTDLL
jgi:hypothetical protein